MSQNLLKKGAASFPRLTHSCLGPFLRWFLDLNAFLTADNTAEIVKNRLLFNTFNWGARDI